MRKVPAILVASWGRLASDSAIEALSSSHALHRGLAGWQAALVKEALSGGASWEEIGDALGTTRQGAWARFRVALGDHEGVKAMQDRQQVKQRVRDIRVAGQARLRDMEAKWRDEQDRLRVQLKESKEQFVEAKRRHQRERHEARHQLRREIQAVRT